MYLCEVVANFDFEQNCICICLIPFTFFKIVFVFELNCGTSCRCLVAVNPGLTVQWKTDTEISAKTDTETDNFCSLLKNTVEDAYCDHFGW